MLEVFFGFRASCTMSLFLRVYYQQAEIQGNAHSSVKSNSPEATWNVGGQHWVLLHDNGLAHQLLHVQQ